MPPARANRYATDPARPTGRRSWPVGSARPSGEDTLVSRDDGKKQWALKGKPLVYWARDQKPGDKTGDGFNKVWRVARE